MTNRIYPLQAVRALALHTQGLDRAIGQEPRPTSEAIYQTIEALGCIQIDTLQMVARSQYLVLWSRLGSYNIQDFDDLIYNPSQRRLFEYWKHAASILPLSEYRYQLPVMDWYRQGNHHWNSEWAHQPGSAELTQEVLAYIRQHGAVRAADFEHERQPHSSAWWEWKPAKRALEHLFDTGDLMIANRVKFQRVYDLRERVLPAWVDLRSTSMDERNRQRVEQAVKALGACEPPQAAEYAYLKRGETLPYVRQLLQEGTLLEIEAGLPEGQPVPMITHRDHLHLLEQAACGDIVACRVTFLSPFDSLFWAGGRDERLWGFSNVLEAYKPAHLRRWGYFCLPILYKDQLVGRFDPKLERKDKRLRIKSIYLENDRQPDEELVVGLASALRDFLIFHDAVDVSIESSEPNDLGRRLEAAL